MLCLNEVVNQVTDEAGALIEEEVADEVAEASDAAVSPRTLFRGFAIAEVFTWVLLITAMILRGTDVVDVVRIAGGIHGFVFLCYVASTVFVWVNQKWSFGIGVTGLIAAVIPLATLPFEIWVDRRGLLKGGWRLAPGGQAPQGFIEQIQAWILRRPYVALILLILLVVAVFLILLWLGPPIPKS